QRLPPLRREQRARSSPATRSDGSRDQATVPDVPGVVALVASFVLAGFTPVAAGPAGGNVLTGTFPGTARLGYVYLPPGYRSTGSYPVVYLLHGMPGSPSEYLDGTDLAQ